MLALAAAAACGISPTGPWTAGEQLVGSGRQAVNQIYFLKDGELHPVLRAGLDPGRVMVIGQLLQGPSEDELRDGVTTQVSLPHYGPVTWDHAGEVMTLRIWDDRLLRLSRPALAQLACTATAVPGVSRLEIQGSTGKPTAYTCEDFKDLAPRGKRAGSGATPRPEGARLPGAGTAPEQGTAPGDGLP
ncbi:hypothetical protein D5H75_09115 [Bailinhaonella thermotolerans]|uniref:GerMN domain-containing protein n=1 Tax=Bailinhaonella thermotolerans TaxID=1070861 RepID=A0A3A4AZJ8_9ACTN|nr:hypothetical protein D5H75_09115 [Bailinhaonella thermotolerans]